MTVNNLTVKVLKSEVSGNSIKIFNNKADITDKTSANNRLQVGKRLNLKAYVYVM